jgi:Arc/MetJ-type ribon-helix-helix transcriptional regulator
VRETTVEIPENLHTRLEAESMALGVSMSELIRQGIVMLLKSRSHSEQAQLLSAAPPEE